VVLQLFSIKTLQSEPSMYLMLCLHRRHPCLHGTRGGSWVCHVAHVWFIFRG
jgi:hypothetical protein